MHLCTLSQFHGITIPPPVTTPREFAEDRGRGGRDNLRNMQLQGALQFGPDHFT